MCPGIAALRSAGARGRSPVAVAQSLVRGVLKGYAGPMSDKQADLYRDLSIAPVL